MNSQQDYHIYGGGGGGGVNQNFYSKKIIPDIKEPLLFLLERNITDVYTSFFTRNMIIFESKEKICASCWDVSMCDFRGYDFGQSIRKKNMTNYLLPKDYALWNQVDVNEIMQKFLESNKINYSYKDFGTDYSLYFNFSKPAYPEEVFKELPT